jgi:hypothetical protein
MYGFNLTFLAGIGSQSPLRRTIRIIFASDNHIDEKKVKGCFPGLQAKIRNNTRNQERQA